MKKTIVFAAAALAALATPAAAKDAPTVRVGIADLDLTQAADREKLEQRIATKARIMCRSGARGVAAIQAERACRLAVTADAASKIELAIAEARHKRLATIALDERG